MRPDSTSEAFVPSKRLVLAAGATAFGLLIGLGAVQSRMGSAPEPQEPPPPSVLSPYAPGVSDVHLRACEVKLVGEFAGLGLGRAVLDVRNDSGRTADYRVDVEFLRSGRRVGVASAVARAVAPGATVGLLATSQVQMGSTCRVYGVTRS